MMSELEDAVAEAYVWGYPLVAVQRTRAAQLRAGSPTVVRDRLAGASDRSVVAPNNDTLYSSSWFDLRCGDVTVDVEPMASPARYWSVMLLDAYTNVSYVCRRLHGPSGASVRVTYDPTAPAPAERAEHLIRIGTPTLWVLGRVLVEGPDDLAPARAAHRRIHLHQRPSERPLAAQPDEGFFEVLRRALALDPPASWHPPAPPGLDALLDDLPPGPLLDAGRRRGDALIRSSRGIDRTANGWGTRSRGAAFGDDVAYRAAFARFSLAGHLPAENRSYARTVDGSEPSELLFAPGDPPVGGFWSLSAYGPDLFFVANELGRYSLGDRTRGLRREPDGSLRIRLGSRCPESVTNWLPLPTGPCHLVLRAYEGRPEVVDARWFPPDPSDVP